MQSLRRSELSAFVMVWAATGIIWGGIAFLLFRLLFRI
jgi:hypothetical protein